VVLRVDGGPFIATSDALEGRVRSLVQAGTGVTTVVLSLEGVDDIDAQGAPSMGNLVELTADAGVQLRLARIKPAVRSVLRRDGSSIASARNTSTATSPRRRGRATQVTSPGRRQPTGPAAPKQCGGPPATRWSAGEDASLLCL
jgi:anti-anti-sigma regulatory factor